MHELLRRHQFRDVGDVCSFGITLTECHALEVVVESAPLTVVAVAARLRLNKSTASRALQSLEEKKLVRRRDNRGDARAWSVEPTAAGRRLSATILESSAACYGATLSGLSPAERRLVIDAIRRLAAM